MSQEGEGAVRVRRAAEREHAGTVTREDRQKADRDAAAAHPQLTDTTVRKGHPQSNRWRDRPVDSERDKDIKEGGIEGAAREQHGRP
jgi:hypothetical protein